MDENNLWDIETSPIEKKDLTEEEKKLAEDYSNLDMNLNRVLPIFDITDGNPQPFEDDV